jgi:hypothetical protein
MAWITKGCGGPLLVLPAFYNDIAMGACMSHLFQGEPLLVVKVLLSQVFFLVYLSSHFLTCFLVIGE